MRVKNQYPDWAEKFRGPGKTIRKAKNGYGLYKCTSVYVPGEKYPKSKQEYLGMITEKDGFIPKKTVSNNPSYIEYGVSRLIWMNFKRELVRSSFMGDEIIVRISIVKYARSKLWKRPDDPGPHTTPTSRRCFEPWPGKAVNTTGRSLSGQETGLLRCSDNWSGSRLRIHP